MSERAPRRAGGMHQGEIRATPIRDWLQKHPVATGWILAAAVVAAVTLAGILHSSLFGGQLAFVLPGEFAGALCVFGLMRARRATRAPRSIGRVAVAAGVVALAGWLVAATVPGVAPVVMGDAAAFATGVAAITGAIAGLSRLSDGLR